MLSFGILEHLQYQKQEEASRQSSQPQNPEQVY